MGPCLRARLLLACLALAALEARAEQLASCTDLATTVGYLTEQVARSELTFVRNGKPYPGAEAAQHMRRKYDHFRDEIQTAEDFIDRAGTRSLVTGEPYMIITKAGERMPTAAWLRALLRQCRAGTGASDLTPPVP